MPSSGFLNKRIDQFCSVFEDKERIFCINDTILIYICKSALFCIKLF